VLSSTPLGGKFQIQCTDFEGNDFTSIEMSYNHWTQGIDKDVQRSIPFLAFNIYVRDLWDYSYRENGVTFAVIFDGIEGQIPLCSIENGANTPMTGESDIAFSVTSLQDYGVNRLWDATPLEFLMADAQSPGVRVTVDGLEALCINMNCEYAYIDTVGTVTTQAQSQGRRLQGVVGKEITVTGTEFPTTDVTLEFGGTSCDTTTIVSDGSSLTCTLLNYPAAGTWFVSLIGTNGLIPVDQNVSGITIDLNVDSISPNTDLNQNGGDILSISGDGFPLSASDISITFSDGSTCIIVETTDTLVTCMVDGFVDVVTSVTAYDVTIDVNGVVDTSISV